MSLMLQLSPLLADPAGTRPSIPGCLREPGPHFASGTARRFSFACWSMGGKPGGRSTYGECFGALSWKVESGYAGDVDLAGMRAVLASRYHDDETGSPWTFALFVDDRGEEPQRKALADIFTGRL